MKTTLFSWVFSIAIAGMFILTGLFKLRGNAEALDTFSQIGGAPAMYFTGVIELVTAVLLLIPMTRVYGALLAVATMTGAIITHVAGLMPNNDDMLPFAIVLFGLGMGLIFLHRHALPIVTAKSPATDPAPGNATA